MKTNIFLSILFFVAVFYSCKKKKDVATPAPVTVSKPQMSCKLNGVDNSCNGCFSSYYSSSLGGVNFGLGGNSLDRFLIGYSKLPVPGTYTLVKYGDPYFVYQKDNYYYRGRGILTITKMDSSANRTIRSLAGTFSCSTDSSSDGTHFVITEGNINVNTP